MVWQELMDALIEATRDWILAQKAAEEHRKKWQEAEVRRNEAFDKMTQVKEELLYAVESEANDFED